MNRSAGLRPALGVRLQSGGRFSNWHTARNSCALSRLQAGAPIARFKAGEQVQRNTGLPMNLNLIRALAMALGTGGTSWSSRLKRSGPLKTPSKGASGGSHRLVYRPYPSVVSWRFFSAPSAALRAPPFLLLKADQSSRRAAENAEKKQ